MKEVNADTLVRGYKDNVNCHMISGMLRKEGGWHKGMKPPTLTRFNKIAIQGTPQMAVDKEAISLSRVYSY